MKKIYKCSVCGFPIDNFGTFIDEDKAKLLGFDINKTPVLQFPSCKGLSIFPDPVHLENYQRRKKNEEINLN